MILSYVIYFFLSEHLLNVFAIKHKTHVCFSVCQYCTDHSWITHFLLFLAQYSLNSCGDNNHKHHKSIVGCFKNFFFYWTCVLTCYEKFPKQKPAEFEL